MAQRTLAPQSMLQGSGAATIVSGKCLPQHLALAIPLEIRVALSQAYTAARDAKTAYIQLRRDISLYLYRLCPKDESCYIEHCKSVERLVNWGVEDARWSKKQGICFTSVPKIPSFILKFHTNRPAYNSYLTRHAMKRNEFHTGPLDRWRRAKYRCEQIITNSDIPYMDRAMCWDWWGKFLQEVSKWESTLNDKDQIVPSWSEANETLLSLIEERVELEDYLV